MSQFTDYNFKETTKRFIELNRFTAPTPIQQKVIPLICKGKDVIGISATGTGKTHAFLIPIMERIDTSLNEVQVVITAPTRELALQLYTRASEMSEADETLRVRLISGGIDKQKQSAGLKIQPHVVIGTPGRIKDLFLQEQTLRVEKASLLVEKLTCAKPAETCSISIVICTSSVFATTSGLQAAKLMSHTPIHKAKIL